MSVRDGQRERPRGPPSKGLDRGSVKGGCGLRVRRRTISPVTEGELRRSVAKADKARDRVIETVDCRLRILLSGNDDSHAYGAVGRQTGL